MIPSDEMTECVKDIVVELHAQRANVFRLEMGRVAQEALRSGDRAQMFKAILECWLLMRLAGDV